MEPAQRNTSFQKVAFIGLGKMGFPMAHRLLSAGFPVVGFDLSTHAAKEFTALGGKVESTVSTAILGADCVITVLPNGKIVQDALFNENNPLEGALEGALLLEMSSSAPADTRILHGRLTRGMRLVDAPVSGGVKRAVEGTLAIMAGGDAADIDQAQPLFAAMASKVFRCGPVGAGHAMKAINNFVSGAGMIAAIEAVQLGESFGLDPENMIEVLNASSGRNNATEVKMKQFILSGTFGSGFAAGLMAKDIRIAAQLSLDLGLDQPHLEQTADVWDAAARELGGDVDHTRISEYLKRKNRTDPARGKHEQENQDNDVESDFKELGMKPEIKEAEKGRVLNKADTSESFKRGLKTRREVLGNESVEASLNNATDFSWPMQKLVTEYCWDAVWNRPGLSRRDRSILNLGMISILNRQHELRAHVRGALNNGLKKEEIAEILLQVAIYGGVPGALDSFRTAQAVIDEMTE
jgi:3-hydroxyisobutyrate dehydrogenase